MQCQSRVAAAVAWDWNRGEPSLGEASKGSEVFRRCVAMELVAILSEYSTSTR